MGDSPQYRAQREGINVEMGAEKSESKPDPAARNTDMAAQAQDYEQYRKPGSEVLAKADLELYDG